MSKKIVLKVDIIRPKCKAVAMTTVAKIPGIKSLEADEGKGTMTVVGEVDVVQVVSELRKQKFAAEVVSVGPEKEEKKPDPPKKPEEPPCKTLPPPPPPPPPPCCPGCNSCRPCQCAIAGGGVVVYEDDDRYGCIIV